MKTEFIVLSDNIDIKIVQVDLLSENEKEKVMLNQPHSKELENHIIFSTQAKFPNYALVDTIESKDFPKRTIVKLQKSTGF